MDLKDLIGKRKAQWERLSELLQRESRLTSKRLSAREVAEVARLYRLAASDLAKARLLDAPEELIRYLNDLVARGHSFIYRSKPSSWGALRRFYGQEFPRLLRRRWPYVAAAAGVFLAFALGAFVGVWLDSTTVYNLLPESVIQLVDSKPRRQGEVVWSENLRPVLSSVIMTNNIGVSLRAYAYGIVFGIGTVYILAFNGALLGALAAHFQREGMGFVFCSLVLPHGVLELMAIFVACGAGLRLGHVLFCPGELTRKGALVRSAPEALRLFLGAVPALVVAALIEGFITPTALPAGFKLTVGGAAGAAALGYALLVGRE